MREWIDALVKDRYKTVATLAKTIGMSESGFSRAVKAGTFKAENLLRLADETGESPKVVFDRAKKSAVNDLIERLYGRAHGARDPDAAKAAELMAQIEDQQAREGFLMMMRGYLTTQATASTGSRIAKQEQRHR